jgi:hypothetical protein
MKKLRIWITRTSRPAYPSFSETCIHVHKPEQYEIEFCDEIVNGEGGIGWSGEYPNQPLPLPEGKHMGLKPGECKRATLIIEE